MILEAREQKMLFDWARETKCAVPNEFTEVSGREYWEVLRTWYR